MPLFLIVLFPLLGVVINGLFGRKLPKPVPGIIASAVVFASFVVAVLRFLQILGAAADARTVNETAYQWMAVGKFHVDISFMMDQLSGVMILIVTGIGFLIHVYSIGYMEHDHNDEAGVLYARFFTFLNLFIAFMSVLVLADNYLLMFVGWEGVGLCSYFLIGFWFKLEEAAEASKKAFIVNRIGDFGFLLGMMLIFLGTGSLKYAEVFKAAAGTLNVPVSQAMIAGTSMHIAGLAAFGGVSLVTVITLLLTLGATGKSAQIPLFVWLPDAMAGPTPVSALIHAATMVTAGIYMAARSATLFEMAPDTKVIVCVIGALTALCAGLTALAHTDIKKVLAYSTVSQLGFMFMGIGAGAYVAAIFHVFTHAFFKACLFLGSGSVIHAMHGEQDMRKMGGLARKMKATNITFMLAGLALSGAVPFAGFFSKDEIIAQVFGAGGSPLYPICGIIGLITAGITAIYTGRQYAQVFLGEPRFTQSPDTHDIAVGRPDVQEAQQEHAGHEGDAEEGEVEPHVHAADATAGHGTETHAADAHATDVHTADAHDAHAAHDVHHAHEVHHVTSLDDVHESSPLMTLPLYVLAVGAVFAGFLGVPHIPGAPESLHAFANWLEPVFPKAAGAAESGVNWALLGLGVLLGWGGWIAGRTLGLNSNRALLPESTDRISINELYNQTVVKVGFAFAGVLLWIDRNIVDGIVNGVGGVVGQVSTALRLTQTSYVRNYALGMALGAAVIIAWFVTQ